MSVLHPHPRRLVEFGPDGVILNLDTSATNISWMTGNQQAGFDNVILNPFPDRSVRLDGFQIFWDEDAVLLIVDVELEKNTVSLGTTRVTGTFETPQKVFFDTNNRVVFDADDVLSGNITAITAVTGNEVQFKPIYSYVP